MNRYSEILKEYIKKSNLSLSEIENGLRKKGFNKNKSYLSNLQNGKVEPPSTDVSIALAEIVGADPLRLILTPLIEYLQQNKESIGTTNMNFLKETFFLMTSLFSTFVDVHKEEFYQYIISLSRDERINEDIIEYINYENMIKFYDEISEDEIIKIFLPIETDSNSKKESEVDELDELDLEVTSDEKQYLIECLQIYRKMQLKPKDQN